MEWSDRKRLRWRDVDILLERCEEIERREETEMERRKYIVKRDGKR